MDDFLKLIERPQLRRPYLVMAFAGWPDAGEISTGALRYLITRSKSSRLGQIASDPFYDFTASRPIGLIENGEVKAVRFPSNDLFFAVSENVDHDFIFFLGTEPHLRWETYVGQLLQVISRFSVSRAITLGSLFDNVPHTREARVSAVATTELLRQTLQACGATLTSYHGSSTIHTFLHRVGSELGIELVSLWGHAPLYLRAPTNPRVCWSILNKLNTIAPLGLDLSDLYTAGEYLTESLNKLLAENESIRLFVRRLEEAYEEGSEPTQVAEAAAPDEEGADQIIHDVEEFLRREQRRNQGGDGGGAGPP